MVAPKFQRSIPGGFIDVFPLAIPDGEGLSIPVKLLGGVGFWNMRGVLVLQVPPAVSRPSGFAQLRGPPFHDRIPPWARPLA